MSRINPYGECKDCRFFDSSHSCRTGVRGRCRKTHPNGYDTNTKLAEWPLVWPDDGCGEWEKLTDRQQVPNE